ncbi:MAG: glycosyltransferase family 39 protein [Acidobacteria bacterium]|nr:glycosyltransferase family 39 protein [Acidobacteriota bacterium]
MSPQSHARTWQRFLLAALLFLFIGRIVLTYRVFNDSMDENTHIRAGLEILQKRTYTVEAQHPPLARFMVAVLPFFLAGLRVNEHNEIWGHGAWTFGSTDFYWKSLALARAGNLAYAVLLFCIVYHWSWRLYGVRAGLVACLLLVCSPTLIGHASLATLDLAAAATVVTAAYFFWRWSEQPGLRYCLASAAAFGLAALSKFSALYFLPPLALLYFVEAGLRRWRREGAPRGAAIGKSAGRGVVFCAVFFFLVWAGYLFDVGIILPPGHQYRGPFRGGAEQSAPGLMLRTLGRRRLPAHQFVRGIIDVLSHNRQGQKAYLLGHITDHGWWYYFPVAVGVKTTIPMLALAGMGIALYATGRYAAGARGTLSPLLAVAVILGLSTQANLNIGVRHVLPIYPLFAILAAGLWADPERLPGRRRTLALAATALAVWQVGESVAAHPDYLAYFNQIARGREERFLLDSNLDWGQDLARLGRFQQEHHIETIHLNYFGVTIPGKVGVRAIELPPFKPVEGWSAISLNKLIGVYNDRSEFKWLRERMPTARAGKSIWIYYVPPGDRALSPGPPGPSGADSRP